MSLTPKQIKEVVDLALPLMYWLKRNCHPHCEIRIDQEEVIVNELLSKNIKLQIIADQATAS